MVVGCNLGGLRERERRSGGGSPASSELPGPGGGLGWAAGDSADFDTGRKKEG